MSCDGPSSALLDSTTSDSPVGAVLPVSVLSPDEVLLSPDEVLGKIKVAIMTNRGLHVLVWAYRQYTALYHYS